MEPAQLLVLVVDAGEATHPGAEQREHDDDEEVHHLGRFRPERFEPHDETGRDHSANKAEVGADQAVPQDVGGFEIVAGVDVLALEPCLVLGDDVQKPVQHAHLVQIVRDPVGAVQVGRQVIQALHNVSRCLVGFPCFRDKTRLSRAWIIVTNGNGLV